VLGGGLLAFLTARSFRVPPFASLILGVVAAAGAGFAVGPPGGGARGGGGGPGGGGPPPPFLWVSGAPVGVLRG